MELTRSVLRSGGALLKQAPTDTDGRGLSLSVYKKMSRYVQNVQFSVGSSLFSSVNQYE